MISCCVFGWLLQVLYTCPLSPSPRMVSLQLKRRVAYCSGCVAAMLARHQNDTDTAAALTGMINSSAAIVSGGASSSGGGVKHIKINSQLLREAHSLEQRMWVNGTEAAAMLVASGLPPAWSASLPPLSHLIALYWVHARNREKMPKSVVAVRHISTTNPHIALPMRGWDMGHGDGDCAMFLHLKSQVGNKAAVRPMRDAHEYVQHCNPLCICVGVSPYFVTDASPMSSKVNFEWAARCFIWVRFLSADEVIDGDVQNMFVVHTLIPTALLTCRWLCACPMESS